jgi:hypothetical protein
MLAGDELNIFGDTTVFPNDDLFLACGLIKSLLGETV